MRADVQHRFGRESRYLLVEALVDQGVVASPLVKYIDLNIRICRPIGLTPEDLGVVIDHVISRIGLRYDRRNFWDLTRYLLPFHMIPSDAARGRAPLRQRARDGDDLLVAPGRGVRTRRASRSSPCPVPPKPRTVGAAPAPADPGPADAAGLQRPAARAPSDAMRAARLRRVALLRDREVQRPRRRRVRLPAARVGEDALAGPYAGGIESPSNVQVRRRDAVSGPRRHDPARPDLLRPYRGWLVVILARDARRDGDEPRRTVAAEDRPRQRHRPPSDAGAGSSRLLGPGIADHKMGLAARGGRAAS